MKKISIIVILILIIVAGMVYYYRYDIFQYSVEAIVKRNLPPYISVKAIEFDFDNNIFNVKGLSIRNPRGYLTKLFMNIDIVSCRYQKKGKNILDGIEVTEILIVRPVINMERSTRGRVNVTQMGQVMGTVARAPAKKAKEEQKRKFTIIPKRFARNISNILSFTDTINVRDGEVFFLDYFLPAGLVRLRCEKIDGIIKIKLDADYTKVLFMESSGRGIINGDRTQQVSWVISVDPRGERLKMSNTYEIRNIDMTLFAPYYYKYSPIIIDKGSCSGTLVFNFDGDDIGSTNILKFKDLKFRQKRGRAEFSYWDATVPELIKYLQTSTGEIIFDFKIKGNIENPRFYLGPYVKRALRSLVVDKVSETISSFVDEDGAKGDVEKVINIMKGILKR